MSVPLYECNGVAFVAIRLTGLLAAVFLSVCFLLFRFGFIFKGVVILCNVFRYHLYVPAFGSALQVDSFSTFESVV